MVYPKSLIQPLEILLVKLTGTHVKICYLRFVIKVL